MWTAKEEILLSSIFKGIQGTPLHGWMIIEMVYKSAKEITNVIIIIILQLPNWSIHPLPTTYTRRIELINNYNNI